MSSAPVVRAVDLGFGNAKFVVDHLVGGEIHCESFPSLAPLAGDQLSGGGGYMERPNTVVIDVDGKRFEVGPGVGLARSTVDPRILHTDYIRTPEYMALMRGIFHYMNTPHIDLLVVGLPVGMVTKRGIELKKLLRGRHETVAGHHVYIADVECMAQPVGGYVSYIMTSAPPMMRSQANLMIDVGFYTLDWLLCDGMHPVKSRSGHVEAGVSALLKRMAERVSEDFDMNYRNFTALDKALRSGYLDIGSSRIPIGQLLVETKPVIDKAMTELVNTVGNGSDIQNILVAGGGGRLYIPSIQTRFPNHPVVLTPSPMYANVRGFQISGEHIMSKRMPDVA